MTVPFPAPPIALTSLSIHDFRGIERLDLDFRGPDGGPNALVVLAGPNGCGKTAVLEAALTVAGGAALAVGPTGTQAIRRGAKDFAISAEIARPDGSIQCDVTSRTKPSPTVPYWYFSSWRAPRLIGPVDVTVGRAGRRPMKNDSNRLKNVKQVLVNAAAVERFARQGTLLGEYSRWIDRINQAWRLFYPESEHTFQVDLTAPREGEPSSASFDVFWVAPDGSRRLEVDYLSSGQLELFLFLSALVVNDDREGIVFIDEPELHLDPQWHRAIVRCLLQIQPRAQFIVATHSPEIYDAAQYYERHFLVPDDDPRARIWSISHGVEA